MSKRLGVVAVMLLLIASFAVVSASEQSSVVSNGGYIVKPVENTSINSMSIQSIYATIPQGMMN